MTGNRLLVGVIGIAAAIALTGCGGAASGGAKASSTMTMSAAAKDAAYRAAVEAQEGHAVADWPKFKEFGQSICTMDESEFGMSVAELTDKDAVGALTIMVRHQCPGRLPDISKAQDSTDWIQEACAVAPAERTQKQKDAAEAIPC